MREFAGTPMASVLGASFCGGGSCDDFSGLEPRIVSICGRRSCEMALDDSGWFKLPPIAAKAISPSQCPMVAGPPKERMVMGLEMVIVSWLAPGLMSIVPPEATALTPWASVG